MIDRAELSSAVILSETGQFRFEKCGGEQYREALCRIRDQRSRSRISFVGRLTDLPGVSSLQNWDSRETKSSKLKLEEGSDLRLHRHRRLEVL